MHHLLSHVLIFLMAIVYSGLLGCFVLYTLEKARESRTARTGL
mgnify:CR=1 FL=1